MQGATFVSMMRTRGKVRMMWGIVPPDDQLILGILPVLGVFVLSGDRRFVDVKGRTID